MSQSKQSKTMRSFEITLEAAKKRKRKRAPHTEKELANLQPGRAYLMQKAPRCNRIAKNTGKRCKNARVRGSKKCRFHGGLQDVPLHPANIRRARSGEIQQAMANYEGQKSFRALPRKIKSQVYDALGDTRLRGAALYIGAQALMQADEDEGRAFRRWLNLVKA